MIQMIDYGFDAAILKVACLFTSFLLLAGGDLTTCVELRFPGLLMKGALLVFGVFEKDKNTLLTQLPNRSTVMRRCQLPSPRKFLVGLFANSERHPRSEYPVLWYGFPSITKCTDFQANPHLPPAMGLPPYWLPESLEGELQLCLAMHRPARLHPQHVQEGPRPDHA